MDNSSISRLVASLHYNVREMIYLKLTSFIRIRYHYWPLRLTANLSTLCFGGNTVVFTQISLVHCRWYLQIKIELFSSFGNTFSFTDCRKSFYSRENPWHWLFLCENTSCFKRYASVWNLPNQGHMSLDMTKPTKWVCAQRRLRPAWASAQSDQSLRCPHEETLGP